MAYSVYCSECGKHVLAEHRGSFESAFGTSVHNKNQYSLLECEEWGHPSMVLSEEDVVSDKEGNCAYGWGTPKVLYPHEPDSLDPCVPQNIAKSYLEARRSFAHASSYTGTALLCRRTIESVCKDLGDAKGSLEAKL